MSPCTADVRATPRSKGIALSKTGSMTKFPFRSTKPNFPLSATSARPSFNEPTCWNFGSISQLPSARANPHKLSFFSHRIDRSSLSNLGAHGSTGSIRRPDISMISVAMLSANPKNNPVTLTPPDGVNATRVFEKSSPPIIPPSSLRSDTAKRSGAIARTNPYFGSMTSLPSRSIKPDLPSTSTCAKPN